MKGVRSLMVDIRVKGFRRDTRVSNSVFIVEFSVDGKYSIDSLEERWERCSGDVLA